MDEKDDCTHATIEDIKSASLLPDELDRAAERRLLWKCDLHVVPILTVLFMFAFLDRINIGNARLMGLERDLRMTGHQYNIALFVFFVPYILFEVPSNMLLKKMRPSWWLSGIMLAWGVFSSSCAVAEVVSDADSATGILTVCQGVTKSFQGLVVCRVLIGVFEAGFMPGTCFFLSAFQSSHADFS